eukprot:4717803-Alexandrium_andersonii.AAC.1
MCPTAQTAIRNSRGAPRSQGCGGTDSVSGPGRAAGTRASRDRPPSACSDMVCAYPSAAPTSTPNPAG